MNPQHRINKKSNRERRLLKNSKAMMDKHEHDKNRVQPKDKQI
jgi:hypothetical protein